MKTTKEIKTLIAEACADEVRYYEAQAAAYRSIKRKYKKDGSAFVDFRRNFESNNPLIWRVGAWGEETLEVPFSYERDRRLTNSSICENCTVNVDYDDVHKKLKAEGRIVKRVFGSYSPVRTVLAREIFRDIR